MSFSIVCCRAVIKAVKFALAVAGSIVCCAVAICLCRLVDTGDGIMVKTGDKRAYSHLLQCLSVVLQRGNASSHTGYLLALAPVHRIDFFFFNYLFILYKQFVRS